MWLPLRAQPELPKAPRRLPRMALVTSGFGPTLGGVGVVSGGVADALARDADIEVWRHRPHWPRYLRTLGVMLRAVAGSLLPPDFIVFTHIDLARANLVLGLLRDVPYAVLIYGVEVWRPLDRWRRMSLERASAILAISEYTVRKAREANPWLPAAKVVWLGAAEREAPLRQQATSIVLMLGRMASSERYKGHDALIDAWPRVLAAVPDARLVVAGDGDDRARLERRSAGAASITFAGFLSHEDRERLLHSSTALVSISTSEGFGLAALEAAASGLPVVGLKGTVTEELFPDGAGHVLLDSSEPQQLAGALIRLLTDADHARAIGDAGRRRMREVFTIDLFNQRIRGAIAPLVHSIRSISAR
jgi:phosphatidyl-myo-inositol dimannoside synthase